MCRVPEGSRLGVPSTLGFRVFVVWHLGFKLSRPFCFGGGVYLDFDQARESRGAKESELPRPLFQKLV